MRLAPLALAIAMLCAPAARADERPDGCAPLAGLDPARRATLETICPRFQAGFAFDPPDCALLVLGDLFDLLTQTFEVPPQQRKEVPTIAAGFANTLSADNALAVIVLQTLAGVAPATVALNGDPCDALLSSGDGSCGPAPAPGPHPAFLGSGLTLNQVLTDEQEALVGCGPLQGTDCEATGVDPFAAHPASLTQSWVGFDGSCVRTSGFEDWHLANGAPQAGTIGHPGAPADAIAGGRSPFLPDGETPNPDYEPNVDGSITGLVIPAAFGASAGQPFASEMAALSFNAQLVMAALSFAVGPPERDQFDPTRPYAFYNPADSITLADRRRCSFAQPQHCRVMRALLVPEAHPGPGAAAGAAALGLLAVGRRVRRLATHRDQG